MRFINKGNLSLRYIGPYHIMGKIGSVAYELNLPANLAAAHFVFHVLMLKNDVGDYSLGIPKEDIGMKNLLSYEEVPIEILDRLVQKLRSKDIASIKVLWRNQRMEKDTRELKDNIHIRYPSLFKSSNDVMGGINPITLVL